MEKTKVTISARRWNYHGVITKSLPTLVIEGMIAI
jgi:hypothetical protein